MAKENSYNPLLAGDPSDLAERLITLMPTAPEMSPADQAKFDKERAEGNERYREARYGELPAGTYRILEQGGIAGWHLELEVDGQSVVLQEPSGGFTSAYAVYQDRKRAGELARAEIARRHGDTAAKAAQFRFVWGGSL